MIPIPVMAVAGVVTEAVLVAPFTPTPVEAIQETPGTLATPARDATRTWFTFRP